MGTVAAFLPVCVVCSVHPFALARVRVGEPSPSCFVIRPTAAIIRGHPRLPRPSVRPPAAAPPAVQFYFCPRATPSAFSCFAHEADAYMHVADAYMHVDDARVGLA